CSVGAGPAGCTRRARASGDRDRRRNAPAGARTAGRGCLRRGGDPRLVGSRRSGGDGPEDGAGADAMSDTIDITLNGERRAVTRGVTLLQLLASLELDPRAVVVEHNRTIVRRPALGEVRVAPGDAVELVHFVGGGLADGHRRGDAP